ncbi:MAG TPA: dTDP-4-amino-4,6-dideoxygalactose transaminase [Bacteroidales bacterium]|nr:dTDP-4-amino-4,6-dideoxygalactose transaminase [Bacteroidales bacterium]
MIPFNKPYLTGKELSYITEAVEVHGHISGNGVFTKRCQSFFEQRWGFKKCLLTTSCTDALEMCALLLNIKPGDEVIMPSFTFVSTAIAFIRQGAVIKFVDSRADHPGMDEQLVEELITPKTKAIVVVHYAGVACDMDVIMDIANKHNLFVVEDAAQAIDSYFTPPTSPQGEKRPLGSIGHLGCFSFHETKNIQCGEGGMLCINDDQFITRAEILWEKGTNRAEFFRGEVNKYGWVDVGSSFLPSEINAAFLWAQLENLEDIQRRRLEIWNEYRYKILDIRYQFPVIPEYASNNAHMFYLVCSSLEERTEFITKMKKQEVNPVFHYQSLHASAFYKDKHDGRVLPHADRYTDCLVRLPLFYEVDEKKILEIMVNY